MAENEMSESGAQPAASGPITIEHLREIIRLCRENDIAELKVKHQGMRIYVKARTGPAPVEYVTTPPAAPLPVAVAPAPETAPVSGTPAEIESEESKYVVIRSPMVGTFYRAPAPDAAPFVEVGDAVRENTVLCIVEAMKLMNEIKAETRGVVAKILVENAQSVEYNQPLFWIKPE
ncbi:MAG: acetyl-CoA carboxylase biotin carboxyl carrier protein [Candidatus Sumerlaeia bacterium]|nr:acetyl-CoA carboxylase biotin carboxyl carrier protein [Candidatus Sumerlaeia bacterium]